MTLREPLSTAPKLLSIYLEHSELEYLEDPTFQPAWGCMVCQTCNKFSFRKNKNFGSLLYCNFHRKLISNGEHLTHSCELYKKNLSLEFKK